MPTLGIHSLRAQANSGAGPPKAPFPTTVILRALKFGQSDQMLLQ